MSNDYTELAEEFAVRTNAISTAAIDYATDHFLKLSQELQFRSLTHEHNLLGDLSTGIHKLHSDFNLTLSNISKLPKETAAAIIHNFGHPAELKSALHIITKLLVAIDDVKAGK
jgi:hypothetical protein